MFIALGGGAYAATTLAAQQRRLRPDSAPTPSAASEIRTGAVRSSEIHDRSIALRDISPAPAPRCAAPKDQPARRRRGLRSRPTAPPSTPAAGTPAGNARGVNHTGGRTSTPSQFDRDVSACIYSATLAAVQNGPTLEQPPAGRITVASAGGANVLVKTFDVDGSARRGAVSSARRLLVAGGGRAIVLCGFESR